MTIVRTWPAQFDGVVESRFYLRATNLSSVSPYTGQRSAYGPTAQVWVAELSFPIMQPEKWRPLSGLLSGLDGINGLLRMPDPLRKLPLYNVLHAPAITGFSDDTLFSDGTGFSENVVPDYCAVEEAARAGASSIVLSGLPASVDGLFSPGDLIEAMPDAQDVLHGHLYEIVGKANTDAEGRTRVSIRPRLRGSLAAGDQIRTRRATSVFRLASDQEGGIARQLPDFGRLGFTLVEVLP